MTALTTEHFVLQTAASTTVTEASARASLYLMTLSSSLVAIGFASGTQVLAPLVSVVIPVIVILGIFTIVRLVDTGVENVAMKANIAHIRSFYRTLSPDAPLRTNRVRRTWMGSKGMFTTASMIAVPIWEPSPGTRTSDIKRFPSSTAAFSHQRRST